jgi:hypothetical protein
MAETLVRVFRPPGPMIRALQQQPAEASRGPADAVPTVENVLAMTVTPHPGRSVRGLLESTSHLNLYGGTHYVDLHATNASCPTPLQAGLFSCRTSTLTPC